MQYVVDEKQILITIRTLLNDIRTISGALGKDNLFDSKYAWKLRGALMAYRQVGIDVVFLDNQGNERDIFDLGFMTPCKMIIKTEQRFII